METKEPERICRRFLAEGRVQGVGFRRTGAEEARRFHASPEYQAIAVDRKAGAEATVLQLRGLDRPNPG